MGRQLSNYEIEQLVAYHYNTVSMLSPRALSAFTKPQTIEILNAVSEGKTTTDDGRWVIKYRDGGKRFFVRPAAREFVPCGDFVTENVMSRLEL